MNALLKRGWGGGMRYRGHSVETLFFGVGVLLALLFIALKIYGIL